MKMRTNRGAALALSMIFLVILSISAITLTFTVEQTARRTRKEGIRRIRNYYAAVAGLRYAKILLISPETFGFIELGEPGDPAEAETYTVTGTELGGDFFNDISIDTSDITITITEINAGAHQGEYEVKTVTDY